MATIKRVLFSGDIFRTTSGEANQVTNIFWLKDLLEKNIEQITKLPVSVAYDMNLVTYGHETVTRLYRHLGMAPCMESWAQIFDMSKPESSLVEILAGPISDSMLVTFEMPPIMEAILDNAGIPWIDVVVDPLRFLPDLILTFRSSSHFKIPTHPGLVTQHDVNRAVKALRRRTADKIGRDADGSYIFFAQTEKDRTLISDGRFLSPESIFEFVAKCTDGGRLFIKPHPYSSENPLIGLLETHLNGEILKVASAYQVLASSADFTVLTASSSVFHEALAFGKPARRMHGAVQDRALNGRKSLWAHHSPSFWTKLLRSAMPHISSVMDSNRVRPTSNIVRKQLGGYGLDPGTWPDNELLASGRLIRWIEQIFFR